MIQKTSLSNVNESLLLLIDIQGNLLPAMRKKDQQLILDTSTRLLRAADILDVPVLVSEQYPKGLGNTDKRLITNFPETTRIADKTTFSSCGSETFLQLLDYSGRKQIVVCGMETHVCVLQTVMNLLDRDYHIFVVEDGVCSRNKRNKRNALERMNDAGAIITNREAVMFEWLKDSTHEHFKEISSQLIV